MSSRAEFRRKMVDAFSLSDLATLCSDLGVDADLIPGRDKGKAYWADQIITYFQQRQRLPDLIAALKAARSDVAWAYQPAPGDDAALTGQPVPLALIAGGAGAAVLLIIILAVALRPAPAAPTATATPPTAAPAATATSLAVAAEASATPAATATAVAAQPMPADHYNILFAEFGQIDQGALKALPEGQRLSQNTADGFKRYLTEGLPPDVQLDFPPLVWHSGDAASNGWSVGPLASQAEAQALAEKANAQIVVYGNFVITGTSSQLELGFYVAKAANAADEIIGPYQLGAPIPVRWPMDADVERVTRLSLNDRNRLLSRFALGLAYDFFGRSQQALEVFQSADKVLPPDFQTGRDVLYFFIAREHLLLRDTAQAELMHRKALAINPGYTRAHIGLGDVYFQYAAAITDTRQLLESDVLRQAEESYTVAESQAALTTDVPQLLPLARLGLGLAKQMRAKAHFDLDERDAAQPLTLDALRLMEPALTELGRRPDGQRRTLALGYLSMGEANWISARMAAGSDNPTDAQIRQRDAFYAKADAAYKACIELDVGTDAFLSSQIVEPCKRNQRRMSAEMP